MNKIYIFLGVVILAMVVMTVLMIGWQQAGIEDSGFRSDVGVQKPGSGDAGKNESEKTKEEPVMAKSTGDIDETISSLTEMSAKEDAIFDEETADAKLLSDDKGTLVDLENYYDETEIR
jgi:hypothetical protein